MRNVNSSPISYARLTTFDRFLVALVAVLTFAGTVLVGLLPVVYLVVLLSVASTAAAFTPVLGLAGVGFWAVAYVSYRVLS